MTMRLLDADKSACSASDICERIDTCLDHAIHYLPTQGPIQVFVHHNTLHAFEDKPFHDGVMEGMRLFGGEPYFSEARYHSELRGNRINDEDIDVALMEDLRSGAQDPVDTPISRYALRRAMLRSPVVELPPRELKWLLSESDTLQVFPPHIDRQTIQRTLASASMTSESPWTESRWLKSLFDACLTRCRESNRTVDTEDWQSPTMGRRHAEWLKEAFGEDPDELVHEVLIRFCGAFLDQGFATMTLPDREQGFLASFVRLYSDQWMILPEWARSLPSELKAIADQRMTPHELIKNSMDRLGVEFQEWDSFISRTLLTLWGWAGMACQMESHCPWTARPAPHGTLLEFLAVRLLLDRLAATFIANKHLGPCDLAQVRQRVAGLVSGSRDRVEMQAFQVFQVARELVWNSEWVLGLSKETWGNLIDEIRTFDGLARRRVLHTAYERHYRVAGLSAILAHHRSGVANQVSWKTAVQTHVGEQGLPEPTGSTSVVPCYQVITCIDDREESLRRHLEEIEPRCDPLE